MSLSFDVFTTITKIFSFFANLGFVSINAFNEIIYITNFKLLNTILKLHLKAPHYLNDFYICMK